MDKAFIQNLKKPCTNRGLQLVDNNDGTIAINGDEFDTIREAEEFISKLNRVDMIEYTWRYCPECDDDYLTLEDGETCVVCGCELEEIE